MGDPVAQAANSVDIKQEFHPLSIIDLAMGHLRKGLIQSLFPELPCSRRPLEDCWVFAFEIRRSK